MKQRIDIEQLMSLSDEQKEKLRKLWKPESWEEVLILDGFPFVDIIWVEETGQITDINGDKEYKKENILPVLSIGQMIEILEEKQIFWEDKVFYGYPTYDKKTREEIVIIEKRNVELCDVLFEALKEVL